MFAKLRAAKENEKGFTLVELLVVIIIIGILAAVAIPAFLNQRQRANDAAVQSDVKNVSTQIETALVEAPNSLGFASSQTGNVLTLKIGPSTSVASLVDVSPTVNLTTGVSVRIGPPAVTAAAPAGTYLVQGAHTNGKQYKNGSILSGTNNFQAADRVLVFNSAAGGLQTGAVAPIATVSVP